MIELVGIGYNFLALAGYCGSFLVNIVLKKIIAALTEQKFIYLLVLK